MYSSLSLCARSYLLQSAALELVIGSSRVRENNCVSSPFWSQRIHSRCYSVGLAFPLQTFTCIFILSKQDLVFGDIRQSQVISRKMALFDRIAFLDAEHSPDMKLLIREGQESCNSFKMLFWAPISIRGHTELYPTTPGTWRATNVHSLPMNGIQIRMSSDLWNEWPSHHAFLKWGSSMNGVQYDN